MPAASPKASASITARAPGRRRAEDAPAPRSGRYGAGTPRSPTRTRPFRTACGPPSGSFPPAARRVPRRPFQESSAPGCARQSGADPASSEPSTSPVDATGLKRPAAGFCPAATGSPRPAIRTSSGESAAGAGCPCQPCGYSHRNGPRNQAPVLYSGPRCAASIRSSFISQCRWC
jgi:hypothetical protein